MALRLSLQRVMDLVTLSTAEQPPPDRIRSGPRLLRRGEQWIVSVLIQAIYRSSKMREPIAIPSQPAREIARSCGNADHNRDENNIVDAEHDLERGRVASAIHACGSTSNSMRLLQCYLGY